MRATNGHERGAAPRQKGRTIVMNTFTKFAAIAVAALTLAVGSVATSSEAKAWGKKGWGGPALGLGIAAGVIGAAAYAATAPVGCRYVERYDRWGNYRGTVRICDVY
jgi:hypothetical protein